MDEHLILSPHDGVNVWTTDTGHVCVAVEDGTARAQVTLTSEQAKNLRLLLDDAIAEWDLKPQEG